jgi:hypothetical protein
MPHPATWRQALPESLLARVDKARAKRHHALMERVERDQQQIRRLMQELEHAKQRDAGALVRAVQRGKPAPGREVDVITAELTELQERVDAAAGACWSSANELLTGVDEPDLTATIADVRRRAYDELNRLADELREIEDAVGRVGRLNAEAAWLVVLRREQYGPPFVAGSTATSRALDEIASHLPLLRQIVGDELVRVAGDEPAPDDGGTLPFTFRTGPLRYMPVPPRRPEPEGERAT